MTRWWTLALLVALIVAPAAAQGLNPEEAPQAGDQAGPADAATMYEDVRLLIPIRTLGLSDEQLARLAELNSRVLAEAAELEALRAELWEQYRDDFDAILGAWLSGQRVDGRAQRSADTAVQKLNDRGGGLADSQTAAAERFADALSQDQAAMVEPEAVAARQALSQRLGGFDSPGAFIASGLDALRDLMPEEYRAVAQGEATRMATAIVGPDSPDMASMAGQILSVLDEVRAWAPGRYQQQHESLPAQINATLGFDDQGGPPVKWDEIVRLVSSARTPAVIALVRGAAEDETQ